MSRRRGRGTDRYRDAKERLRDILLGLGPRLGLTRAMVDALVNLATIVFADAGDTIFLPSETHDFSYVLIDGLVRIETAGHRGRPVTMQLVGPGRLFGVSWLPLRRPREVRAVAQTDVAAALVTQRVIEQIFREYEHDRRVMLMSYQWRALSGLLVQQGSRRRLDVKERTHEALWDLAPEFGRAHDDGVHLGVRVTSALLASLVGAAEDRVRHVVPALIDAGSLRRDDDERFVLSPRAAAASSPPAPPYRGVPAPWARPALEDLVGRCQHMGLNGAAAAIVSRHAAVFEVPADGLLVAPDAGEVVAFVVAGSAWLEGVARSGEVFAIQLVPPGRFVRLPTGPSSRGTRLQARAHRDCIAGLLPVARMRDAVAALDVAGALKLLDVTCRGLSRHLCDVTTAPSRTPACRVLWAFVHLAHDFPKRADVGVLIDVPLTLEDVGRLANADHAAVCRAVGELGEHGYVERVAPQRYVLRKSPPPFVDGVCAICEPRAA